MLLILHRFSKRFKGHPKIPRTHLNFISNRQTTNCYCLNFDFCDFANSDGVKTHRIIPKRIYNSPKRTEDVYLTTENTENTEGTERMIFFKIMSNQMSIIILNINRIPLSINRISLNINNIAIPIKNLLCDLCVLCG
jgi:hypothetical protein